MSAGPDSDQVAACTVGLDVEALFGRHGPPVDDAAQGIQHFDSVCFRAVGAAELHVVLRRVGGEGPSGGTAFLQADARDGDAGVL